MNILSQAKARVQALQSVIPTYDVAAQEASFEAELAYIRNTVGFIDSVMLDLNCQESEMGHLDGCFINLYKLSPRGATPLYLIFVDNKHFDSITEAVRYMASRLQF